MPEYLISPEILPGFEDWFEDFFELSTDRRVLGDRLGPIPSASIDRHPDAGYPLFKRCIRAMDAVYLRGNDAPDGPDAARDGFRSAMRALPDKGAKT